ncbi:MAG: hypothetical protein FJ146_01755 [Deltaproteobacteria bacterium]|nr:hypothetical protein [Deltaproteobacteria bacterium]
MNKYRTWWRVLGKRSLQLASLWSLASGTGLCRTFDIQLGLPEKFDHAISPLIYGLGTYMGEAHTASSIWSLRPTYLRFGGNMAEVFNWQLDTWNTGSDWYFTNFKAEKPGLLARFMSENQLHGVASAVVIPTMGWVAKDAHSGSFPETVYGKQVDSRNGFGNGIRANNGEKIIADPNRALTPVTSSWTTNLVSFLKTRFGNLPHRYIIGNEPMLWHETHRDAHPTPATYDEVLTKFLATATAVRKSDPAAVIIGPALWGFLAIQQSAFDERGSWSQFRKFTDRDRHGGKPFLEWFLAAVKREEQSSGMKLLDVVDVHFYPANEEIRQQPSTNEAIRKKRIRSVRSLWDRSYQDESWINDKIYFIPRLKELIDHISPGLKLAIGEYNFGAEDDISGAIALAETLGVFAREGLWAANYWTIPKENSPAYFAFKIFRNYDGLGASFAPIYVAKSSLINDEVAVFTAFDPDRRLYTLAVLNKSLTDDCQIRLVTTSKKSSPTIRHFSYTEQYPQGIRENSVATAKSGLITVPKLSVNMIEMRL